MWEVKEEKFGSRPSVLRPIFEKNGIWFEKNIYFVTCKGSINRDKKTRYLIFLEALSKEEFDKKDFFCIKNCIKEDFLCRTYIVFMDDGQNKAYLKNAKGLKKEFDFCGLKKFILNKTKGRYVNSGAKGGKESSPFSKFFRENLGAGFALTDIDFLLPNAIFVEEKTFFNEANHRGYIGHGQCLSFNELLMDVFQKHCEIYIIFTSKTQENFYLYPYRKINCSNALEKIEGWGNMVVLDLERGGYKYNKEGLIELFKKILKDKR